MKKLFIILLISGVSLPAFAQLQTADDGHNNLRFRVGGHYKNLFTYAKTSSYSEYQHTPDNSNKEKTLWADMNRLRISPELDYNDNIHVHIDFDNESVFASYLKTKEFEYNWHIPSYNELSGLQKEHDFTDSYYRCKAHRAFAKFSYNDITVTAGKQQIRFGSARLWNPLDLLNPVVPTYIEGPQEQRGTDAVRTEYFITDTAEIDLIIDGKRIDNDKPLSSSNIRGNTLARLNFTCGETEIAALSGYVSKKILYGFDVSSVLFDGMLKTSAVHVRPQKHEFGIPYTQASLGYEYNFNSGIYFLLEYFYNENGLNYNSALKYEYEAGLIYGINKHNYYKLANQLITYNRHYTGVALGYNIFALLRAELFAIYDFEGKAVFLSPSFRYNILQNADIVCGIITAHIFDKKNKNVSDFDYLKDYGFSYFSFIWYF